MSGLEVFLGNGDVKDAFHRFRLRRDFALWFGVGEASAHGLRITGHTIDGTLLHKGSQVDLVWTSLLMSFSWSVLFCQHIIQDIVTRSLVGRSSLSMRDRSPPAVFRLSKDSVAESSCARAHYVYVDNLGVVGCGKREVEEGLDLVVHVLEETGLKTHEISSWTQPTLLRLLFRSMVVTTARRSVLAAIGKSCRPADTPYRDGRCRDGPGRSCLAT